MAEQTEILSRIQKIFREALNNEEIVLQRETHAGDIEEWDSLNHMILVIAIEKEFDLKFGIGELQSFQNVGDMIDLIIEKST